MESGEPLAAGHRGPPLQFLESAPRASRAALSGKRVRGSFLSPQPALGTGAWVLCIPKDVTGSSRGRLGVLNKWLCSETISDRGLPPVLLIASRAWLPNLILSQSEEPDSPWTRGDTKQGALGISLPWDSFDILPGLLCPSRNLLPGCFVLENSKRSLSLMTSILQQ